jgi:hypothetical protein
LFAYYTGETLDLTGVVIAATAEVELIARRRRIKGDRRVWKGDVRKVERGGGKGRGCQWERGRRSERERTLYHQEYHPLASYSGRIHPFFSQSSNPCPILGFHRFTEVFCSAGETSSERVRYYKREKRRGKGKRGEEEGKKVRKGWRAKEGGEDAPSRRQGPRTILRDVESVRMNTGNIRKTRKRTWRQVRPILVQLSPSSPALLVRKRSILLGV